MFQWKMVINSADTRYQHCNRLTKLIRYRHMILVPFKSVKWYLHGLLSKARGMGGYEPWSECWSLAVGMTQATMNYYYTWEEAKCRLGQHNDTDME